MDNRDFHTPPPSRSDLAPERPAPSQPLPPPPYSPSPTRRFLSSGFRWLFIVRMSLAMIVGLGLSLGGAFFLLNGHQGFDRNIFYMTLIGLAMFLIPGFFLLRTLRTMRAEKAAERAGYVR